MSHFLHNLARRASASWDPAVLPRRPVPTGFEMEIAPAAERVPAPPDAGHAEPSPITAAPVPVGPRLSAAEAALARTPTLTPAAEIRQEPSALPAPGALPVRSDPRRADQVPLGPPAPVRPEIEKPARVMPAIQTKPPAVPASEATNAPVEVKLPAEAQRLEPARSSRAAVSEERPRASRTRPDSSIPPSQPPVPVLPSGLGEGRLPGFPPGLQAEASEVPAAAPEVHVHIGRVEVRAPQPPSPRAAPKPPDAPRGLDQLGLARRYLDRNFR